MAEKEQKEQKKQQKEQSPKETKEKKKFVPQEEKSEILVRILGYDIPGSKNIYAGLTRIKGISWTISNAICIKLNYPRTKKISELTNEDIIKIEDFLKNLNVYTFLKNRRADVETGQTSHLYGADLDMKREFDIKRLKEIKSYKGVRHSLGQPVRGQRTRSHFRKNRKVSGGIKKAIKKETKAA